MVDVVDEYVLLAARSGRLLPGLVDVPLGARRRVAGEPVPTASALVRAAGRLALRVTGAGLDGPRARFLVAQVHALECTARRLAGQNLGFVEDVAGTFGVTIGPGTEHDYRIAHLEIAELLPGRGALAARVAAYRRCTEVPPDRLLPALRALSAALRERAATQWPLPDGEHVEYRLVTDAPWTALHTWLGRHRSMVTVNLAARPRWTQLPALVAHEAYPGHHVQRCRAESVAQARPEHGVVLMRSPQSVLAEGAAEEGLGVLVGPAWGTWAQDVLGPVFDGGLAERLGRAGRALLPVRQDAALLLHDRRRSSDAVELALRHLRRWLLVDDERARRIVASLTVPLWRGHVAAHVEGPPMVNSWLRRGIEPLPERYRRLLDEPLLPVDLLPGATERVQLPAAVRASEAPPVGVAG